MRVLVIGAGPAGIACAYFLERAQIPYEVVDQAEVIASTWAQVYPSLRLNTTRFFSHLPGQRFPLAYGIFPTGKQYHRYLHSYARRHGFRIRLGVMVRRVEPDRGGWKVTLNDGGRETISWYPVIIAATGRFSNPFTPAIPGLAAFRGSLIHARDYQGAAAFLHTLKADRPRIVVVGSGPSGVDIAVDLGRHLRDKHPVQTVLLAMRTGIVLRYRYPLGLPKHLWMMISASLPFLGPLIEKISEMTYRNVAQSGIRVPTAGQTSSAASVRGPDLIRAVRAGQVICVDGVRRFLPDALETENGSIYPVDAVILATGYCPALAYLTGIDAALDADGWPVRSASSAYSSLSVTYGVGQVADDQKALFKREVAPGLFLVGTYYQGRGALYNFNIEAQVAVHQISEYLARWPRLPDPQQPGTLSEV